MTQAIGFALTALPTARAPSGLPSFLANEPLLSRSYQQLDVDRLHETATEKSLRTEIARAAKRARCRTSDRALPRLVAEKDGRRRIVDEPPLITRVPEAEAGRIAAALDEYLTTLAPHWRRALGGYTLVDIAHKVVGVGSVGLRAYVALLEGSSADDVVFLQLKQARRSVLARYVHGDSAWHAHQGQRVVEYQQALQTVSDPLLGWATIDGRQYYVRQYRDMKWAPDLTDDNLVGHKDLVVFARLCGTTLARAHARTSEGANIAEINDAIGAESQDRDALRDAMVQFGCTYADVSNADQKRLRKRDG